MDHIIQKLMNENDMLKHKIYELEQLIHNLHSQTMYKIDELNNILKNDFYMEVFKEHDDNVE